MGKAAQLQQDQQLYQQPHFAPGSVVEVSTDEEGFKGVFFVATVLESPSSRSSAGLKRKIPNPDKLYVEYHSLLAHEHSSVRLREYVDKAFVRPSPPQDKKKNRNNNLFVRQEEEDSFEVGDVVDAYYKDGWWTGVVTRVLDHSKYVVTFQNPPDEQLCDLSELRVHRKWENGTWVRPPSQIPAGLLFSVGKAVEVSFDKEDCRDCWFPATVLQDFGNGSFLVEYKRPMVDDEVGGVQVTVDSFHLRPSPPNYFNLNKQFIVLEKVDGFFDFGWWFGVITQELAESRYSVFFKQLNIKKELSQSELRPHMDWKDGNWFTSSQDNSSDHQKHKPDKSRMAPHGSLGLSKSNSEEALPSSLSRIDQVQQSTSCNEEIMSGAVPIKKRAVLLPSGGGRLPQSMNLPEGSAAADSQNGGSSKQIGEDLHPGAGYSETNSRKPPEPLAGDKLSETPSWGKRSQRKRFRFGEKLDTLSDSGKKKGKPGGSPRPIILGLACNLMKDGESEEGNQEKAIGNQSQQFIDPAGDLVEKRTQSAVGESQKRKRGRPPKTLDNGPLTLMTVAEEQAGNIAKVEALKVNNKACEVGPDPDTASLTASRRLDCDVSSKEHLTLNKANNKQIMGQTKEQNKSDSRVKKTPDKMPSDEVVHSSVKHPSKRGRKRTMSLNSESQVQDSIERSGEKTAERNGNAKVLGKAVSEELELMFDDAPLSKWIEEMHPLPSSVNGTTAIEQCSDGREKETEFATQSHADPGATVPVEDEKLPFKKSTQLWATIECMEVFKRMPQRPHFHPLEQCKESSREGLAIGCMVNYCSVVEKTSKLQYSDPRSTFEDVLDTLDELESHGFDIQVVRDRVTGLLRVKEEGARLEGEIEDLNGKVDENNVEKAKIDEEIEEIKNQMEELQEKLLLAESKREIKDGEIASLQSRAEETKKGISSAQRDFDRIATRSL